MNMIVAVLVHVVSSVATLQQINQQNGDLAAFGPRTPPEWRWWYHGGLYNQQMVIIFDVFCSPKNGDFMWFKQFNRILKQEEWWFHVISATHMVIEHDS